MGSRLFFSGNNRIFLWFFNGNPADLMENSSRFRYNITLVRVGGDFGAVLGFWHFYALIPINFTRF
jgi:hypothetical protein